MSASVSLTQSAQDSSSDKSSESPSLIHYAQTHQQYPFFSCTPHVTLSTAFISFSLSVCVARVHLHMCA